MEKCNIKEFLTKHYFQRYFTRGKQDLSAKNIPNDSNATPPSSPPKKNSIKQMCCVLKEQIVKI